MCPRKQIFSSLFLVKDPFVCFVNPIIIFKSVVYPDPFLPEIFTNSPKPMSKVMLLRIFLSLILYEMF